MQFTIRSLLLGTAFVAVTLGGIVAHIVLIESEVPATGLHLKEWLENTILASPFWAPIVIAAFSIGRRSLTTTTLVYLVAAQAAAIASEFLLIKSWGWK